MAKTIRIASVAPFAVRVGNHVISGANAPDAVAGVGITSGVDADEFRAWMNAEIAAGTALASLMSEMPDEAEEMAKPIDPELPGEAGADSSTEAAAPVVEPVDGPASEPATPAEPAAPVE